MAFHHTSRAIALRDGSLLAAECRDREGGFHASTLDLDRCLGNDDGAFAWGGVSFSRSARRVELHFPLLCAELRDRRGRWRDAEVDLSQRLENVNGALRYEWGGAVGSALDEVGNDIQRMIFDPLERTVSDLLGLADDREEHRRSAQAPAATPLQPVSPHTEAPREASAAGDRTPIPDVDDEESHCIALTDLEPRPASEIGERLLRFLTATGPAPGREAVRTVRATTGPDRGVRLDFESERETFSVDVSEQKRQALQRENGRAMFDADAERGIQLHDHAESAKEPKTHDAEAQKKVPGHEEPSADDEEMEQLRREVESIDTESRLDTPDFSDGEDDWLVSKSK